MKPSILSASLLPLFATLALACSGEDPEPPPPPPPDYLFGVEEQPYGKTYEEWAQKWFEWALTIPKAEHPVLDGPCDGNQMGDVFFLAGNVGGQTTRACAVPSGKAIFFPIVNSISRACPEYVGNPDLTCESLTSEQTAHDNASTFFEDYEITKTLEIDGHAITDLDDRRAHTATFNDPTPTQGGDFFETICSGPIGENPCDVPVGSARIAAADGYWVMLKPLPAGDHEVRFTAKIVVSADQTFELDVTYDLTVAP